MQDWQFHHLPEFGFHIGTPSNWSVQDNGMVLANRERVDMGSPFLQRRLQEAALPIFISTRFPASYNSLNPTVQAIYRPMPEPGMPPTQLLTKMMSFMGLMFPEFQFVEVPTDAELGGQSAARARATYAMIGEERRFDVLSRSWLVPCGEMMFLVNMSGTTQGDNVCEDEFNDIAESIRIDPNAIPELG